MVMVDIRNESIYTKKYNRKRQYYSNYIPCLSNKLSISLFHAQVSTLTMIYVCKDNPKNLFCIKNQNSVKFTPLL